MKKISILLLAMLILSPIDVAAQKVHKILFGHTTDESIGETIVLDMDRASNEIDEIGAFLNYEVVNYIYSGEDCSKENLEKCLANLAVSNNDIIVFYYSGHGGHSKYNPEDKWPQMCLNKPAFQEKYVPLRSVIERLGNKRAHFCLVLSDCCNDVDDTGYVTVKGLLKSDTGSSTIDERTKRNYQTLFLKNSGTFAMTSSKLGQTSGCNVEDGGFFSMNFFDTLYEAVNNNSEPSWKKIADGATAATLQYTRNKQEPYYDLSQLHAATTPAPPVPIPPVPTPTPIGSTTSAVETAIVGLLANQSVDSSLASIPSILSSYFSSPDIYVLTVGRNLKTVVGTESASEFLRRVAQNKNIVKINIIKEQKDANGKCIFLTVHEVRK